MHFRDVMRDLSKKIKDGDDSNYEKQVNDTNV